MSLITPDFGLIFWMTLIFGVVFFILAKFGFPAITSMVHKRQESIEQSLKDAALAREQLEQMEKKREQMMQETLKEQAELLADANRNADLILQQAREQVSQQSEIFLEQAREQIEREKEAAMRQIRQEVAGLSVEIARKVLKDELSLQHRQEDYLNRIIDGLHNDNRQQGN